VTLNQETMAAVRLLRWQSEAELVAVPVPEPGLGRGAAQGEAAGLCHSDLCLMEWSAGTLGRGAIRAETECFTLGQAVDAYRRLRRGEMQGRAMVTPGRR
jgi:D-arabinose 1-dehydrogenase-like Zn-dependent alcohol dehydrogenase